MTDATLFVGGRVYAAGRYAEALLVENGRVLAVGAEAAVRRAAPTGAERRDLGGGLVIPGLADAHLHLGELARSRAGFDAAAPRSLRELREQLRAWAESHPTGPVVGRGLDIERLAERRWPTIAELDEAIADRPVVLAHASGHAAVANSAARAIGPDSPRADRSESSVVVEEALAAFRPLVEEALPLSSEALEETLRGLAAFGLTSVGTMNTGVEELAVLETIDRAGRLPIRVRAFPPLRDLAPAQPKGTTPSRLEVAGGKAFLDGAFGPRTAALEAPYSDEPSTRGVERGDDPSLADAIVRCRGTGRIAALHALGDRAVARAARLLGPGPASGPIGRLEHAGLVPPPVLAALRSTRPTAVVQPGFVVSDVWLRDRLGPMRSRWAYPFRSLLGLGIPVAGSSDAPYDAPDPWRGMRAAVERRDPLGRSANPSPDEALSEPEAFALYGASAHRALGDPGQGTLAPGALADLVVLSVSSLSEALRAGAPAVVETWVEGRCVARSGGPAGSAS